MNLTRAQLPDHLGQWVTVSNPLLPASWYGCLIALTEDPSLILALPGGGQATLPQGFTVTGAEPPPPGALSPRRQAAYDAVYELIGRLGPELPPDTVHRNATIWHAVNMALDAAGVQARANPAEPDPAPGDNVPAARDTVEDTVLATGGHLRTPPVIDETGCDLTSGVPARPHPGDNEDTSGDRRGDGIRFAYTATVRRGQVRHAIAEAFELLDRELHPRRPALDEEAGRDA